MSEINELKGTFTGLKIIPPENGSTNVNAFRISTGKIFFQESSDSQKIIKLWNFANEYELKNDIAVKLNGSTDNEPQLYSVYAKPDNIKISDNITNLTFFTKNGVANDNPGLPEEDTSCIFLGSVFVPSRFPSLNTTLYYRSVSDDLDSYNLLVSQTEWVNQLKKGIEVWDSETIYFEDQLVRYQDCFYICLKNHASGPSFNQDLNDDNWIISCSTGGVIDENITYEVILVQNGDNGAVPGDKYYCIYEKIQFLDSAYAQGAIDIRRLVTTLAKANSSVPPITGSFEHYTSYS